MITYIDCPGCGVEKIRTSVKQCSACEVQERNSAEIEALQQRVCDLEAKLEACNESYAATIRERNEARATLRLASSKRDDVWMWQSDGGNHPESLVCPVIMSAETLRALLAGRSS